MLQDAGSCDEEIKELREHQGELSESLEQKQINCQQLQGSSDTLDGDISRLVELKQKVGRSHVSPRGLSVSC